MADPVDHLGILARGHEGRPEVREDPLYGAVPRGRYRLDPPTDEENPHAFPRGPWD